jgi:hypothetical protein
VAANAASNGAAVARMESDGPPAQVASTLFGPAIE